MKSLSIKNLVWNFVKRLASLNISILILFLIIIFSIIGSIIEQDQNLEYYQNYYTINNLRLFSLSWQVIIYFGLDHLYRNWWFICLIILFVTSLTICTLSTQLPSLKNARRWKFINSVKQIDFTNKINLSNLDNSYANMIYALVNRSFYVFHKRYCLYAYKGLWGRFAPIIVHLSIIITLFSSMISLFFGCSTQEMIPTGEMFHLKNIVRSGFFSTLSKTWVARVKKFSIDYNNDSSIHQFFSELSIFDNYGKMQVSKIISVNSPMKFNGFTFYQTDWQVNTIRLIVGDNRDDSLIVQKKVNKIEINGKIYWLCSIPISLNSNIFLLIINLKDNILLCNSDGFLISQFSMNETFYINNIGFRILGIISDTGLQIKIDPGVYFIYFGFLFLMLSSIISYLSYSQIWVYILSNTTNLTGSTNRAVVFFEEEISKIHKIYLEYTFMLYTDKNFTINEILR